MITTYSIPVNYRCPSCGKFCTCASTCRCSGSGCGCPSKALEAEAEGTGGSTGTKGGEDESSAGRTKRAISTHLPGGRRVCEGRGSGEAGTCKALESIAAFLGNEWDILGFDPRRVHCPAPAVKCFPSASDFALFRANTLLEQEGFTVPSVANLSDPNIEAALEMQSRDLSE
ncbi:hypothetical protein B0H13DRAFT_2664237 [Mycena leptocephala]|nr:hypothetical protein B0H13DRAFT_2664237 [Mycena leptocephala]